MNALTLRPVIASIGVQISRTLAYWKNSRASRSRWCSPIATRLRSAGVSVPSRTTLIASSPHQWALARVGPRPNWLLKRLIMAFEISIRISPEAWRGLCSYTDDTADLSALFGERRRAQGGLGAVRRTTTRSPDADMRPGVGFQRPRGRLRHQRLGSLLLDRQLRGSTGVAEHRGCDQRARGGEAGADGER